MDGGNGMGTRGWIGSLLIALVACGSSDSPGSQGQGAVAGPAAGTGTTVGAPAAGTSGSSVPAAGNDGGGGAGTPDSMQPGDAGAPAAGTEAPPAAGAGGDGEAGAGTAGTSGTAGAAGAPFAGPVDGDPSKPMVSIDGVPCGVPRVGFGGSPPTVKITNRDVVVAYPCAHEGAAVTFFLFLHGTLQEAQKVPFTMNAFPIHQFVDTDNVIVVVPKAVGTQWGNGDNGVDLPHLYEVVDWVYDTFGEKFDIRSMWASGGSWGSFYLSRTFACDRRFENRLRGVRMVVGSPCPSCTGRLSCIVAEQELEEGGGMPLSPAQQEMKSSSNIGMFAAMHGCDGKMKMPDLGPVRHWTWPNCDPGFVHSYYLGPGQHADPWNDPTAMRHMVTEIKSIE
jgi:hypothetical protein